MATFNHISGAELPRLQLGYQTAQFFLQLQERIKRVLMNAPADFEVKKLVLLIRENHQIFWSVIKAASVDVVNMFIGCQGTANDACHHNPMLRNTLAVDGVNAIAVADCSLFIRSSQIFRVKQLGRTVIRSERMFHAEGPQLVVVARALFRTALTARHIAKLWEWRPVRQSRPTSSRHVLNFNIGAAA